MTKAAIRAQLAQAGREGGLSLSDWEALAGIPAVPMPGGWQDWVMAQKVQTNRELSPPAGGPRPLHEAEIPFAGYLAANHLTGQETSDDHLDELHRMNGAALETRVNMDRGNVARDMQRTGNRVTRLAMAGTALIEEHRLAGIHDPGFMAPPFAAGQQTGVARHVRAGLCDENGLDTARSRWVGT